MKEPEITESTKREARQRPNGWVYVVDPHFDPSGNVPPEAIVGAWKVSSAGTISGDFVHNASYNSSAFLDQWRKATTPLELTLQRVARGVTQDSELYQTFADSVVWVFNGPESGFHLITLEDGVKAIYAFTDAQLARSSGWPDVRAISGRDLSRTTPAGVRILLNAGYAPAASLSSADIF